MPSLLNLSLSSVIKWVLLAASITLLGWYGLFQARYLITGPTLTLDETVVGSYTEPVARLTGTAQHVTSLTLNDRPIFVDEEGAFDERLVLEQGYTIMTLKAYDRYGRSIKIEKPLIYTPAYASST
jgi:hypothetical protein